MTTPCGPALDAALEIVGKGIRAPVRGRRRMATALLAGVGAARPADAVRALVAAPEGLVHALIAITAPVRGVA